MLTGRLSYPHFCVPEANAVVQDMAEQLGVVFTEHTESGSTRIGFVDVAPSDFKQMKEAYELEHKATHGIKTMEGWQQFAEETGNHSLEAYFKTGDRVGRDVINHFTNIMPPG